MKTRTCERCGEVLRPGEKTQQVFRDSVSAARPSATIHAECPHEAARWVAAREAVRRRRDVP
ncbi:hypothetical protein RM574_05645 [Streptomyces sp. DSM 41982]|uniref:Uncharacterized protein n=1 Tax=Streptomyces evansiae TaxID=3075535 RepID=A0ABD5E1M5_9ACTN|nr:MULTISPECIES: hypothetical protein [unclassified Streptomyces]MDT0414969.1 hypothetical protein [Streptomyces sp. DSM 41982]SCD78450.1 hypothetical protein GA0115246_1060117 [Streptomyces sp. SolWspMP-sol7th]